MMSMTDLLAIGVETPMIDSGCFLKKEFTELIRINLRIVIVLNCQSCLFMSRLCMWSFDLRHQKHLLEE